MAKFRLIYFVGLLGLTSCDPVHSLYFENQTTGKILIQTKRNGYFDTLSTGSTFEIGHCTARYTPKIDDIDIDYMRIIADSDTLTMTGKTAIFSMLQKVESLNWRIIYRDK